MGKVCVNKEDKSKVQSKHEIKKWRKCEKRANMRQRKEGWQGWVKHFIFPSYSLSVSRTAENLSSIDYWDLMFQSTLLPPSIFPSLFHFPFVSVSPPSSVYLASTQSKCAKQKKQSVTEHFYILLMLQLFSRWFDNINCCPQCYWRADPSKSRSARLRPRWIRPLAAPKPEGPALIQ